MAEIVGLLVYGGRRGQRHLVTLLTNWSFESPPKGWSSPLSRQESLEERLELVPVFCSVVGTPPGGCFFRRKGYRFGRKKELCTGFFLNFISSVGFFTHCSQKSRNTGGNNSCCLLAAMFTVQEGKEKNGWANVKVLFKCRKEGSRFFSTRDFKRAKNYCLFSKKCSTQASFKLLTSRVQNHAYFSGLILPSLSFQRDFGVQYVVSSLHKISASFLRVSTLSPTIFELFFSHAIAACLDNYASHSLA